MISTLHNDHGITNASELEIYPAGTVARIDSLTVTGTGTDTVTTIPYENTNGTRSLKGAVSFRDGSIVGIANNNNSFLHNTNTNGNNTPEYVLYPYYNKL